MLRKIRFLKAVNRKAGCLTLRKRVPPLARQLFDCYRSAFRSLAWADRIAVSRL
jgi:hypothetical protein